MNQPTSIGNTSVNADVRRHSLSRKSVNTSDDMAIGHNFRRHQPPNIYDPAQRRASNHVSTSWIDKESSGRSTCNLTDPLAGHYPDVSNHQFQHQPMPIPLESRPTLSHPEIPTSVQAANDMQTQSQQVILPPGQSTQSFKWLPPLGQSHQSLQPQVHCVAETAPQAVRQQHHPPPPQNLLSHFPSSPQIQLHYQYDATPAPRTTNATSYSQPVPSLRREPNPPPPPQSQVHPSSQVATHHPQPQRHPSISFSNNPHPNSHGNPNHAYSSTNSQFIPPPGSKTYIDGMNRTTSQERPCAGPPPIPLAQIVHSPISPAPLSSSSSSRPHHIASTPAHVAQPPALQRPHPHLPPMIVPGANPPGSNFVAQPPSWAPSMPQPSPASAPPPIRDTRRFSWGPSMQQELGHARGAQQQQKHACALELERERTRHREELRALTERQRKGEEACARTMQALHQQLAAAQERVRELEAGSREAKRRRVSYPPDQEGPTPAEAHLAGQLAMCEQERQKLRHELDCSLRRIDGLVFELQVKQHQWEDEKRFLEAEAQNARQAQGSVVKKEESEDAAERAQTMLNPVSESILEEMEGIYRARLRVVLDAIMEERGKKEDAEKKAKEAMQALDDVQQRLLHVETVLGANNPQTHTPSPQDLPMVTSPSPSLDEQFASMATSSAVDIDIPHDSPLISPTRISSSNTSPVVPTSHGDVIPQSISQGGSASIQTNAVPGPSRTHSAASLSPLTPQTSSSKPPPESLVRKRGRLAYEVDMPTAQHSQPHTRSLALMRAIHTEDISAAHRDAITTARSPSQAPAPALMRIVHTEDLPQVLPRGTSAAPSRHKSIAGWELMHVEGECTSEAEVDELDDEEDMKMEDVVMDIDSELEEGEIPTTSVVSNFSDMSKNSYRSPASKPGGSDNTLNYGRNK